MKEAIVGLTFVEGVVFGVKGKKRVVQFLVDSGATYTLIPNAVWEYLGLKPKKAFTFVLADGTSITRQVSECKIRLLGEEGHTPIILGEAEDEPLLGSVTLGILGLVLDPFKRELRPMQIRLA